MILDRTRSRQRRTRRTVFTTLLLSALSMTGCMTVARHPITDRPVRLGSDTEFALLQPSGNDGVLTTACKATNLEANIRLVRGDTLVLTSLRHVRVAQLSAPCPTLDHYLVVVSQYPDLHAQQERREYPGILLSLIPMPLFGLLAFLLFFGDPART